MTRGRRLNAPGAVAAYLPCAPPAGTPLQPSRRWAMGPLMYLQCAKWLAGIAFLTFCIYAVYTLPASCWAASRRATIEGLLWSTIGVFAVVA